MPGKGGASARQAKAEAAAAKQDKAAAAAEAAEEERWSKGAKKGKNEKTGEDKAARKAEAARLLAEEEAALPSAKPAPSKGKKAPKSTGSKVPDFNSSLDSGLSASGIDDALDALTITNARSDKASVGSQAAKIEQHPERRFKAAFEAYKERRLPELRKEHPGLRLQQYHDVAYKEFQKHPDNPFNQVSVAYNASKHDKVERLQQVRSETEERLRSA